MTKFSVPSCAQEKWKPVFRFARATTKSQNYALPLSPSSRAAPRQASHFGRIELFAERLPCRGSAPYVGAPILLDEHDRVGRRIVADVEHLAAGRPGGEVIGRKLRSTHGSLLKVE